VAEVIAFISGVIVGGTVMYWWVYVALVEAPRR